MNIGDDNVTLSWDGKHLTEITLVNKKDENNHIDCQELIDKVKEYMKENQDKINSDLRNMSRLAVGIYGPAEWCFTYGYLVHKFLSKLEKKKNTTYKIEEDEELITEDKMKEIAKDMIKRQRKIFDKLEADIDKGKIELGGFFEDGDLIGS